MKDITKTVITILEESLNLINADNALKEARKLIITLNDILDLDLFGKGKDEPTQNKSGKENELKLLQRAKKYENDISNMLISNIKQCSSFLKNYNEIKTHNVELKIIDLVFILMNILIETVLDHKIIDVKKRLIGVEYSLDNFHKYLKSIKDDKTAGNTYVYKSSTAKSYVSAIKSVCEWENFELEDLFHTITVITYVYSPDGSKEQLGARGNATVWNALKRYGEFKKYLIRQRNI